LDAGDFMPSERVAISQAMKVELSLRLDVNQNTGGGMENFPHPPKGRLAT